MVQINTTEINKLVAETEKSVRDGAYVVVGLGVLGFQRAQVRRRELIKLLQSDGSGLGAQITGTAGKLTGTAEKLGEQFSGQLSGQLSSVGERVASNLSVSRAQLTDLAKSIDERVAPTRVQLDQQVDAFEERLPASARNLFSSVRSAIATPEAALRSAVGLA
jgi:hypothetical protein